MKKIVALLMVSLLVISCRKETTTPTPTPVPVTSAPATINSAPQVSYSINGVAVNPYISNGNTYMYGTGSIAPVNTTTYSTKQYSASIYNVKTSQVYLEIDKGTLSFGALEPDSTTFKNYFTTGSIAYSVNAANGIQITMSDTGATWSTTNGSQTGSLFSIVATQEQWIAGNQYIKFLATFNCTLYDQNGLNPRRITNGVFLGYFENQ